MNQLTNNTKIIKIIFLYIMLILINSCLNKNSLDENNENNVLFKLDSLKKTKIEKYRQRSHKYDSSFCHNLLVKNQWLFIQARYKNKNVYKVKKGTEIIKDSVVISFNEDGMIFKEHSEIGSWELFSVTDSYDICHVLMKFELDRSVLGEEIPMNICNLGIRENVGIRLLTLPSRKEEESIKVDFLLKKI